MKTKEIYYSVQNCGDGSAYPSFYESMELCEWDQEHMDEGWGESCTGTIQLAEEVEVITEITTAEQYLLEMREDDYNGSHQKRIKEFLETFFPNRLCKCGEEFKDGACPKCGVVDHNSEEWKDHIKASLDQL